MFAFVSASASTSHNGIAASNAVSSMLDDCRLADVVWHHHVHVCLRKSCRSLQLGTVLGRPAHARKRLFCAGSSSCCLQTPASAFCVTSALNRQYCNMSRPGLFRSLREFFRELRTFGDPVCCRAVFLQNWLPCVRGHLAHSPPSP